MMIGTAVGAGHWKAKLAAILSGWRFRCAAATLTLFVFVLSSPAREPDLDAIDHEGNKNGFIEPEEILVQDLTIIARYASLADLDLTKPMRIGALKSGRGKYYRSLDHLNEPGNVWQAAARKGSFGRIRGAHVRTFGDLGDLRDVNAEYTDEIRRRTSGTFQKFDANRDGLLSRDEVGSAYKTAIHSWFRGDRDHNGRLTFAELAHFFAADAARRSIARAHERSTWNINGVKVTPAHRRHAARMMAKFDKNNNGRIDFGEVSDSWKTGNGLAWADANGDGRITTREMQLGSVRFLRENEKASQRKTDVNLQHCDKLANDMIRRYDRNRDQSLNRFEWRSIGGELAAADINGNGLVKQDELARWLLENLNAQPGAKSPQNLPLWFVELDLDFDGQVLLSEFLQSRPDANPDEFGLYDTNGDGMVTSNESATRSGGGKTRYASNNPQVLEAGQETWSELTITDDVMIADIDVQIVVAKNGDDDLELRLVGPNGATAWLYYNSRRKAWGGGRMLANTLIDDEAPEIRQRLPRPPAHRSFRPQSMNDKERASLSIFYGKSARGTWRLVIRNKGENRGASAGLLEGWSLLVKPKEATTRP